ncbi:MAG: transcriptional regulator [Bacillales bacterium]|nr:transcriptional regulator [Bacillales bacterium]
MDFKQLEAFTRVIELKSFTRAAESIYLSQASVSLYIHSLEKELNTQLIVRSTKELLPTKSGTQLYEYAKNIIALRDLALFEIQAQKSALSGEFVIMASTVPAQYLLPEILASFNKVYPEIRFVVHQSDTFGVTKGVISQECEFGIVGGKLEEATCNYDHIVSDTLVVIAPPDAEIDGITQNKLQDFFYSQNFIMRESGSGTRAGYENFMKNEGIDPTKVKTIASFSNTQSILHSVSKGLGVSMVSKMAAEDYVKNGMVQVVNMDINMPVRHFYFASKKNVILSPISKLFIGFVHEYYDDINRANR